MNRKLVYEALANVGHISRAELARQTGISAPTIGKIISFFVKSGIVSEAGEGESDLGRKPLILCFNSESFFAIGVAQLGHYSLASGCIAGFAGAEHLWSKRWAEFAEDATAPPSGVTVKPHLREADQPM